MSGVKKGSGSNGCIRREREISNADKFCHSWCFRVETLHLSLVFRRLQGAASYPGQVLDLCVRGDGGVAFFCTVLDVSQVQHAGDDVEQLL